LLRVESSLGCLCALLACGRVQSAGVEDTAAPLGGAELRLDRRVITQLQQSLGVTPERARELAVEDALLALELHRRDPALAVSLERVGLARALARSLLEEAGRTGPPTDVEVEQLTRERWWELDRPRMVQVVHAVVLSESENLEAEALAGRIARAVADAKDSVEFERAAEAVPAQSYTIKVETLPPVTQDGRAIDPARPPPMGPSEQHLALEFAAGALALDQVGQLSPVVRSPFGYHVLQCLRIVEPQQPTLSERRKLLEPETLQRRALAAQVQLLERQRLESNPEQARSALRSMAQLAVQP
jgi:PPIC-type PPIASE domain